MDPLQPVPILHCPSPSVSLTSRKANGVCCQHRGAAVEQGILSDCLTKSQALTWVDNLPRWAGGQGMAGGG